MTEGLMNFDGIMNEVPKVLIESPVETRYKPGEKVTIKVGPATGKAGVVVVERNANYSDYEPDVSGESIAVLADGENRLRWFDTEDDLDQAV